MIVESAVVAPSVVLVGNEHALRSSWQGIPGVNPKASQS